MVSFQFTGVTLIEACDASFYWPISRVSHCCIRSRLYKDTHAQTMFTLSIVIHRATVIIKHKTCLYVQS